MCGVFLCNPCCFRLVVLGRLMTTKFLHREIREKGGAYGGGVVGSQPGAMSFFSYRYSIVDEPRIKYGLFSAKPYQQQPCLLHFS